LIFLGRGPKIYSFRHFVILQAISARPYSVGHWLGMDTHDTPTVPTSTPIAPGKAVQVDPGFSRLTPRLLSALETKTC
jgi:hypothetical protein